MSAILITDMNWPEKCCGCDFCAADVYNEEETDVFFCTRTQKDVTDNVLENTKREDCPLKKVCDGTPIWAEGVPTVAGEYLVRYTDNSHDIEIFDGTAWVMNNAEYIEKWLLIEPRKYLEEDRNGQQADSGTP